MSHDRFCMTGSRFQQGSAGFSSLPGTGTRPDWLGDLGWDLPVPLGTGGLPY